ncbi:MAG TPA: putative sulfate exporter family transporter [Steroidobacteraceae bacterium]|nr:putative sulfate exporter family transporter [Steroidobacteraceae bacterium]
MRALLTALGPGWISLRRVVPGVLVAVALALLARSMADSVAKGAIGLPRIPLSPVMYAVLLGMLWRNTLGVPAWTSDGLNWAMHRLLRIGIALVGLRLTLAGASAIAITALPVALACLATALVAGITISRLLSVPHRLGVLLAIGTAVCGCTAVVAMSPVIRAKHAETAFAVTCVVLFGCVAMLLYPWVAGHFFADSPVHAGVFLGTAIHDTSQVIGSALIYSQQAGAPDALSAASVAKLLRNLSIVVLIPAAAWLVRRESEKSGNESGSGAGNGTDADGNGMGANGNTPASGGSRAPAVPFFVFAFILFVVVRTAGDSLFANAQLWHAAVNAGQTASELFLVCGMTAVGLSVSFSDMWRIGWRPLAAGFIVATLVGTCSLSLTLGLHRLFG